MIQYTIIETTKKDGKPETTVSAMGTARSMFSVIDKIESVFGINRKEDEYQMYWKGDDEVFVMKIFPSVYAYIKIDTAGK